MGNNKRQLAELDNTLEAALLEDMVLPCRMVEQIDRHVKAMQEAGRGDEVKQLKPWRDQLAREAISRGPRL